MDIWTWVLKPCQNNWMDNRLDKKKSASRQMETVVCKKSRFQLQSPFRDRQADRGNVCYQKDLLGLIGL